MNDRNKKMIIVFAWTFLVILSGFSFIYVANNVTNRLYGAVIEKKSLDIKNDDDNNPKINLLINSSGEKVVNENISISTLSSKEDKVERMIYSFDLNKWYASKKCKNDNDNTICKISFKKNINKPIYIRVIDSNGNSSYYSKTKVMIDKKKPSIRYSKTKKTVIFDMSDNYYVSKVQYSNDLLNWDTEELEEANSLRIEKEDFKYKYARVVDSAGNVSKNVKIIK